MMRCSKVESAQYLISKWIVFEVQAVHRDAEYRQMIMRAIVLVVELP